MKEGSGHSGPENLKKSRPKKLVKSNKSISRKKIFWPNSNFCNFKNGQKSIFEEGKCLKLPKMQFHEIIFFWIYLISRVFLPRLFKIFWPAVLCTVHTWLVFGCLPMILQSISIHRNDPHNRKIHHKSDWRWCILHHIDIWIDPDCIRNLPRPHQMHNFARHYKVEYVEYISDLESSKIANTHPYTCPLNNWFRLRHWGNPNDHHNVV